MEHNRGRAKATPDGDNYEATANAYLGLIALREHTTIPPVERAASS
jgi:hypothetical protein